MRIINPQEPKFDLYSYYGLIFAARYLFYQSGKKSFRALMQSLNNLTAVERYSDPRMY